MYRKPAYVAVSFSSYISELLLYSRPMPSTIDYFIFNCNQTHLFPDPEREGFHHQDTVPREVLDAQEMLVRVHRWSKGYIDDPRTFSAAPRFKKIKERYNSYTKLARVSESINADHAVHDVVELGGQHGQIGRLLIDENLLAIYDSFYDNIQPYPRRVLFWDSPDTELAQRFSPFRNPYMAPDVVSYELVRDGYTVFHNGKWRPTFNHQQLEFSFTEDSNSCITRGY